MTDSILARLSSVPALRRGARQTKLLWKRVFFAPLHALRKPRLRAFGLEPHSAPPIAPLRLAKGCPCEEGAHYCALSWGAMKDFARPSDRSRIRRALKQTAAAIGLDPYASFEAWRVQVSRLTQGKYHRSANKARRLGYASRFVGLDSYARSVHELTGSKPRRSKGLFVWAALAGPRSDLIDTKEPPWRTPCPLHGRATWGAFRTDATGETLVAFAMLVRSGDLMWVQNFIGHGAALTDGVTKMLMFDIMAWLLARSDPLTVGVRALVHGSVEEGGVGLFDWKRYLGFRPVLLDIGDAP